LEDGGIGKLGIGRMAYYSTGVPISDLQVGLKLRNTIGKFSGGDLAYD
jgi:hypothetical protein